MNVRYTSSHGDTPMCQIWQASVKPNELWGGHESAQADGQTEWFLYKLEYMWKILLMVLVKFDFNFSSSSQTKQNNVRHCCRFKFLLFSKLFWLQINWIQFIPRWNPWTNSMVIKSSRLYEIGFFLNSIIGLIFMTCKYLCFNSSFRSNVCTIITLHCSYYVQSFGWNYRKPPRIFLKRQVLAQLYLYFCHYNFLRVKQQKLNLAYPRIWNDCNDTVIVRILQKTLIDCLSFLLTEETYLDCHLRTHELLDLERYIVFVFNVTQ